MKKVLFIEDNYSEFCEFSKKMTENGFDVHPRGINTPDDLLKFLGLDKEESDKDRIKTMTSNIYDYIVNHKLYDSLSLIMLDISLFTSGKDEKGLEWLTSFRNSENSKLEEKYQWWNTVIPIVALTNHSKGKYANFFSHPGYLAQIFNKTDVRDDSHLFIQTITNLHEYMSANYLRRWDSEIIEILSKFDEQKDLLKELKQYSELILYSNIASLPKDKRDIFEQNFATQLIKCVKDNGAFIDEIEDTEDSLNSTINSKIQKLFNSTPIKITQLLTLVSSITKIEKVDEIMEKIPQLLSNLNCS
jgi:hypothetical protein